MAHHYKCTRCGATGFNFDLHKCANMRDLHEMNTDILERLARGEIAEDEAWRLNDEKTTEVKS